MVGKSVLTVTFRSENVVYLVSRGSGQAWKTGPKLWMYISNFIVWFYHYSSSKPRLWRSCNGVLKSQADSSCGFHEKTVCAPTHDGKIAFSGWSCTHKVALANGTRKEKKTRQSIYPTPFLPGLLLKIPCTNSSGKHDLQIVFASEYCTQFAQCLVGTTLFLFTHTSIYTKNVIKICLVPKSSVSGACSTQRWRTWDLPQSCLETAMCARIKGVEFNLV